VSALAIPRVIERSTMGITAASAIKRSFIWMISSRRRAPSSSVRERS
jgi:hypothetical protein